MKREGNGIGFAVTCGHSWLVLAPFVAGEKKGRRVAVLTLSFVSGTALACLVLGATLGVISQGMPPFLGFWIESGTSIVLIIIGLLLLYNPNILHSHDHDAHDNEHHYCSEHIHSHCDHQHHGERRHGLMANIKGLTVNSNLAPFSLFSIGFVNMIIPCPTAAVMYGYALNSGSASAATMVFGAYAFSTALAVGVVNFLLFKVTSVAHSLQKEWIEPLVMRVAGGIIVIFSAYGLCQSFLS